MVVPRKICKQECLFLEANKCRRGGDGGGGVIVLCGVSRPVVINLGFNIVPGFVFKSKGSC